MIFRQYLDILEGIKTQTRRVVKPGEHAENSHGALVPGVHWDQVIDRVNDPSGRRKWQRGGSYAVQAGRGGKAIFRIWINQIRQERLHDITPKDIKAEGFESLEEMRNLWDSFDYPKGQRWDDNPLVWVLKIEPVTEQRPDF